MTVRGKYTVQETAKLPQRGGGGRGGGLKAQLKQQCATTLQIRGGGKTPSSVHQVGYGARFEVELMIGHKTVLGILSRAHILRIQAHA